MKRLFLILIFPVATLSGCTPAQSPLQAELDDSRAKWAERGVNTYEYRLMRACFCPPEYTGPIIITVEDGEIVTVRRPDDTPDLPPPESSSTLTIAQLFDTVQMAIDRNADSIIVEYHDQLGYPTEIYVDWNRNIADEETNYSAADLTFP